MHILVVNINNLKMTQNLVNDILRQNHPWKLTLVDNGSSEEGTYDYLRSLKDTDINIIYNRYNEPLNKLWNDFYRQTTDSYLCFLNNDMRIPSNFVRDTVQIMRRELEVGCVVHATNHPDYRSVRPLDYIIMDKKIAQGWDFTIRREVYSLIPEELQFFGGDDYLYNEMYKARWKVAMA